MLKIVIFPAQTAPVATSHNRKGENESIKENKSALDTMRMTTEAKPNKGKWCENDRIPTKCYKRAWIGEV